MKNNNQSSIEDNITRIIELFNLNYLDEESEKLIDMYISAYNQTLEEYNSNPNEETKKRLNILSMPINFAFKNYPDDDSQIPHPAVDKIKKVFEMQGMSQVKSYARTLHPNIPSILPEETNNYQINGFSYAIIVIFLTIFLGIGLAVLLLFIK